MTDLVRVKRGRHPWVTEPESGGGGGGGDLSSVLSNGNDGGGQQIKNIADSTDGKDAVTQDQLDQAYLQGLPNILLNNNSAGGSQITGLADGLSAQDAATVHNIDQTLGLIGINLPLSNDPDAGGIAIKNIGDGVDPNDAVSLQQLQAVAGFPVGSSWLQLVGDSITTNMGTVTGLTWTEFTAPVGSDLSLRAGGKFIDVLTDGWYSMCFKLNINGAASVIQWTRNVSSGGAGTMNAMDEFASCDPNNPSNDMTGAMTAEHFGAGEAFWLEMFADNAGSVGTYDVGIGEMLWMITRLA
jgi:hypothetical protein